MPTRPAIACPAGTLHRDAGGLNVTMVEVTTPAPAEEYWCCDVAEISLCSERVSFEATPVPSVDLITGLIVGVLLLGAIYEHARHSRSAGALPRLRLFRQRGGLFRRLREMLRR